MKSRNENSEGNSEDLVLKEDRLWMGQEGISGQPRGGAAVLSLRTRLISWWYYLHLPFALPFLGGLQAPHICCNPQFEFCIIR